MKLSYDFSDWGLNPEEGGMVERIVREHLLTAFTAFAEEGMWKIDVDDRVALVWTETNYDSPVWGDGFPLRMKITPETVGDALIREILGRSEVDRYTPEQAEDFLALVEESIARQLARVRRAIQGKV